MTNLQFLGFPKYDISSDGKLWSHYSDRYLKGSISLNHHDKYEKYMLSQDGKRRFITTHRLVAYAYLPKPYKKDYVNHIDGNIHNNNVSNLEWVTALENNMHSIENVRKPQFIDSPDLKLPERGKYEHRGRGRHNITEEEAIQYCDYMLQGYRGCDLRIMMGISPEMFTKFKHNRVEKYKHIVNKYDFSKLKSQRLTTTEEVVSVCNMLQDGNTIMHTFKSLGLPRSVVRGIASRKSYKHISKDYIW